MHSWPPNNKPTAEDPKGKVHSILFQWRRSVVNSRTILFLLVETLLWTIKISSCECVYVF